jgi:hypothetical protein
MLKIKSPGVKNRGVLYNGKRHARRFSADTCAAVVPAVSSALCSHPQKETHNTKLFHVHLNRIVGYRICSWLRTEKVRRRSRAAIASSVEEIAVLRKHARQLGGSLFAWLDFMSFVLCESYYFVVNICVVLAPFVVLSFHKRGKKWAFEVMTCMRARVSGCVRWLTIHTFRLTRELLPSSVNSGYIQAFINNWMVNKWVNINSTL